MTASNLANMTIAIKAQSGLGSAASGSGATGLEVVPSTGMAMQFASIQSQLIRQSKMKKRPRQGSKSVPASYETELMVDGFDSVLEGCLGGTWLPSFSISNTDITTLAISGTGTLATAGSGSFISLGLRSGMMGKLTSMSVSGNNGKWFPILNPTASTFAIPTGILADNGADSSFTLTMAKSLYTATPYTERYFTLEAYLRDIDRSKLGTDMKFHQLNFSAAPDQPVKIGFSLMGRDMDLLAAGSSPTFSSPTFGGGSELVLLDGAIYVNGTARTNLTGFNWGLQAPATTLPVLSTRLSPDVFLGQFDLAGQFTGAVEDGTDFDAMDAETQISAFLHCAERESDPADFVSFYLGNLAFGGWSTPEGGEGALIQTLPLYGGEDIRGTGYAATSVLISTSAA
jgi:hypothetical protein